MKELSNLCWGIVTAPLAEQLGRPIPPPEEPEEVEEEEVDIHEHNGHGVDPDEDFAVDRQRDIELETL